MQSPVPGTAKNTNSVFKDLTMPDLRFLILISILRSNFIIF